MLFFARLLTFLSGTGTGTGTGTGGSGGEAGPIAGGGENTAELNEMWMKVQNMVNDVLMPLIYAALGLFLVVKGAILGMQIVKAADEPQVRQEKIGSLKWLVIGVAIAFGVAAVAQVVINFFDGFAD